jgi:uncharacterized protein with HEPN domain
VAAGKKRNGCAAWRNRIARGYFDVNPDVVQDMMVTPLPG